MSPDRKPSYRRLYPDIEMFPQIEVKQIKQRGEQLVSPFWVFSRFGLTYPRQNHDLVIAKLSQTTHGNKLNFQETPKGVRISANNIDPLLKAMEEIYLSSLELLPIKTKKAIDKLFKPQNPAQDWQK
nr:hypothetical protein [Candidatus Levybacteria bacterium]